MDDVTPSRAQRKGCDGQPPAPSRQLSQGTEPSPRTLKPSLGTGAGSATGPGSGHLGREQDLPECTAGDLPAEPVKAGWPGLGCRSQCC